MFAINDVVRVLRDVPKQGVTKGMTGAVVAVFSDPAHAYEVEFVDSEGRTLVQATLTDADLEELKAR